MRNIVLYIATSLDGFIADKKGSVDWLGGDGSDPEYRGSYDDFFKTVDTVIFGYTTYNQIVTELAPGRWDYAGKKCYVVTHRQMPESPDVTFVNEPVAELLERLRREPGGDIWICGGANIVSQAMRARLINKITVCVMPTLLGGGVRLFSDFEPEMKLKLVSTKVGDGTVDLNYEAK